MSVDTTIFYTPELRDQWPVPLVAQWSKAYPQLLDEDDVRNTRLQPTKHFNEWFTAIHLFEQHQVLSLVEKYVYANHPRKREVLEKLLDQDQRDVLNEIRAKHHTQLPDLLVYAPDFSRFWFAEVKGPMDRMRKHQRDSHKDLHRQLGAQVKLIKVRMQPDTPGS